MHVCPCLTTHTTPRHDHRDVCVPDRSCRLMLALSLRFPCHASALLGVLLTSIDLDCN